MILLYAPFSSRPFSELRFTPNGHDFMKYTASRTLLRGLIAFACLACSIGVATAQPVDAAIKVEVDLKQTNGPLDHIWSKCVGSDRAAISLREDWRNDLTRFHEEAGIERVRFHGIFADELGVYAPSLMSRNKDPNWQNVDRVYDGMLKRGVKPYVELSF